MTILAILLVLLVVTRLCGELAVRLGQPSLVGELVSGILLGVVFGAVAPVFPQITGFVDSEAFGVITDLAVFFLMLLAGIELRPRELASVTRSAIVVAFGGVAVPLLIGLLLGVLFLPESGFKPAQTLFIGTALAITAVPVSIKLLLDLGQLHTRFGGILVSAAIIDDVFGFILLAALTSIIDTGQLPSLAGLAIIALKILLFFGLATVIGIYVFPRLGRIIRGFREAEIELSMLLVAALAHAVLAELLGMHFIIGAFTAGLFFGRHTIDADTYERVRTEVGGFTTGFLAPIFFASIGLRADLGALSTVPLFAGVLILAAMIGKLLGAGIGARLSGLGSRQSLCVGIGMSSRGAVELVVADIAFKAGLFALPDPPPPVVAHLFSAVVLMALVTTVVTPVALRQLLPKDEDGPTDAE